MTMYDRGRMYACSLPWPCRWLQGTGHRAQSTETKVPSRRPAHPLRTPAGWGREKEERVRLHMQPVCNQRAANRSAVLRVTIPICSSAAGTDMRHMHTPTWGAPLLCGLAGWALGRDWLRCVVWCTRAHVQRRTALRSAWTRPTTTGLFPFFSPRRSDSDVIWKPSDAQPQRSSHGVP